MRNKTWLEAFSHELRAFGVGADDHAQAVVETEGYLDDAGLVAYDHFGAPRRYAAEVVSALGASRGRDPGKSGGADADVVVTALSKSYRGTSVLRDLSLTVGRGEVVVLTGPNGAGKSTLLRVIAGIEQADSGSVELAGAVGYVPQSGGLDPYLDAEEHFELFGAVAGLGRGAARREGCRLARELGWDAATAPVAGELSGGTRQKLSVIAAMLGSPRTLLLDEPYQGMDAESQRRFWELLWAWQDGGGSAVVSSHAVEALDRASTVVEIEGLSSP